MHLSPYYQTPPSAYEEPELGGHPYADSEYDCNNLEDIFEAKYVLCESVITQKRNNKTLQTDIIKVCVKYFNRVVVG
jgi:hypothetical protein